MLLAQVPGTHWFCSTGEKHLLVPHSVPANSGTVIRTLPMNCHDLYNLYKLPFIVYCSVNCISNLPLCDIIHCCTNLREEIVRDRVLACIILECTIDKFNSIEFTRIGRQKCKPNSKEEEQARKRQEGCISIVDA